MSRSTNAAGCGRRGDGLEVRSSVDAHERVELRYGLQKGADLLHRPKPTERFEVRDGNGHLRLVVWVRVHRGFGSVKLCTVFLRRMRLNRQRRLHRQHCSHAAMQPCSHAAAPGTQSHNRIQSPHQRRAKQRQRRNSTEQRHSAEVGFKPLKRYGNSAPSHSFSGRVLACAALCGAAAAAAAAAAGAASAAVRKTCDGALL